MLEPGRLSSACPERPTSLLVLVRNLVTVDRLIPSALKQMSKHLLRECPSEELELG